MAKLFPIFTKVNAVGEIYLDRYAPAFQENDVEEVIKQLLPYNRLYEQVFMKNWNSVPAVLLERLTLQYLHGAEIIFELPKANYLKTFKYAQGRPEIYKYEFKPLDWTRLPKTVAYHKVTVDGKEKSIIEVLSSLKNGYIPNPVWVAVDKIAQTRIEQCQAFNRGYYPAAERWYKRLMYDYMQMGRKVFSPNKKTYYEVIAEVDFARNLKSIQIPVEDQITEDQLLWLQHYAPAYGVEIPKFTYRVNSRKTDHGWTEEPEVCFTPMTDSEIQTCLYDYRNDNLPANVRKGLWKRSVDCPKYIKDAYDTLKYLMQFGTEFLMPDWHICPICGDVYHEERGCDNCGKDKDVEFLSADNQFYSNALAYEDRLISQSSGLAAGLVLDVND